MGNKLGGEGGATNRLLRCRGGWVLCLDERQSISDGASPAVVPSGLKHRVEELTKELFMLQDLKQNGVLEEGELIKLNQKIAMLHYGADTDLKEVSVKFRELFREKLDEEGRPVDFETYQTYLAGVLNSLDRDLRAQEMILEQWIAEAESARAAFFYPAFRTISDAEFTANMAIPSEGTCEGLADLKPVEVVPPSSVPLVTAPSADGLPEVPRCTAEPARGPSLVQRLEAVSEAFPYAVGERLQVWSNSQQAWLDGVVEEVFPEECHADGFMVPAGTLRVLSAAGKKWVLPGEADGALRKHPAQSSKSRCQGVLPQIQQGAHVEVWSDSRKAWLQATVLDFFPVRSEGDGFVIPAGTVKVRSDAGVKWILPEQVETLLREAVPSSGLAKGDRVLVWSCSRQAWVGGIVQDVFAHDTVADGYAVPAGAVKIVSDSSIKWFRPQDCARHVRKAGTDCTPEIFCRASTSPIAHFTSPAAPAGGLSPLELKTGLAEVLRNPQKLQTHVDQLWAAFNCGANDGFTKDSIAGALEALAQHLGVRLDLKDRHLAAVHQRFDAYAWGNGRIAAPEFCDLSRELISEVYAAL